MRTGDYTVKSYTSNGLLAALFGIEMPLWWCKGMFPSLMVLGLHYAPFAYILIGGIFQTMDANLEEAATILDTPKWRIMSRITLPMVKPAVLSTILLVFGSAMGSYPVPHYLGTTNGYDLTKAGRYKVLKKLNVLDRMEGHVLKNDLVGAEGKVIFKSLKEFVLQPQ